MWLWPVHLAQTLGTQTGKILTINFKIYNNNNKKNNNIERRMNEIGLERTKFSFFAFLQKISWIFAFVLDKN